MITQRGHTKLTTPCRKATNEDIPSLRILRQHLRHAYESCPRGTAAALASTQVELTSTEEVLAAFLYKNKLYTNPSYKAVGGIYPVVEGCLSDPDHRYLVMRYESIVATYDLIRNNTLVPMVNLLSGYDAQVFQHETDHINGRVIWSI